MPQAHLEFQPVNMINVLLDQLMYGWEMGEMQGGVRIRLAQHSPAEESTFSLEGIAQRCWDFSQTR